MRASGQDDSWTPPWRGLSGISIQEEIPGQTLNRLERLVGLPWDSLGGVGGSGLEEESMGCPQGPDKGQEDRCTELKTAVSSLKPN